MQETRSRGVQQHEVDGAADALLAQKLRPTVERVRTQLGRGSPNTVGPMLEAWFARLAPRLGLAGDAGGEPSVPAAVRQAMDGVWAASLAAAEEVAQARLAQEREQLVQQRSEINSARTALATQGAAAAEREQLLREARDLAQRQLAAATDQLRGLQMALEQRQQEVTEARSSIAALVQQKDAAARDHSKELASQTKERDRLQDRAAASERRLLEEVDRARQEAKAAQKALLEAGQHHKAERAELERANRALGKTLHDVELQVAPLKEKLAATEQRATEYRTLLGATAKPAAARRTRKASRPAA